MGLEDKNYLPCFSQTCFSPNFMVSSVQLYKQQGLSVLGDLLGNWSFASLLRRQGGSSA